MEILVLVIVLAATAIVSILGDYYHPAGPAARIAVNLLETDPNYWINQAQATLKTRIHGTKPAGKARNVIMFLGDGMSVPTLAAARTLLGQNKGGTGEEAQLSFETFPTVGMSKTYCVDAQIPDSACTATAYLCGVKNNYGTIGISAAVSRNDCEAAQNPANQVESIADWALSDGRDVGIVTTTRVTHASPGGTFAKVGNRNWETDADIALSDQNKDTCLDITHQLVHRHPGNKYKVILGGGRRTFIPTSVTDEEGSAGRRLDGRNLIEEWEQDKRDRNVTHKYIWNREELMNLTDSLPEYLLGLFESNHMKYHLEANLETEPTLTELTETAIKMLSRNENGFFLFVESGRIDHGHHDNFAHFALDETLELHNAVARATEMLSDEDTLIVVTADHAHVMAFNGYSDRGHNILGASRNTDKLGIPYMTLSYTNGPGFRLHVNGSRPDVIVEERYGNPRWRSHVDFPVSTETHGGDDVAVFAWGPYHNIFTGLYEQHHIPHRMAYAACIGPGLHACSDATTLPHPTQSSQPWWTFGFTT